MGQKSTIPIDSSNHRFVPTEEQKTMTVEILSDPRQPDDDNTPMFTKNERIFKVSEDMLDAQRKIVFTRFLDVFTRYVNYCHSIGGGGMMGIRLYVTIGPAFFPDFKSLKNTGKALPHFGGIALSVFVSAPNRDTGVMRFVSGEKPKLIERVEVLKHTIGLDMKLAAISYGIATVSVRYGYPTMKPGFYYIYCGKNHYANKTTKQQRVRSEPIYLPEGEGNSKSYFPTVWHAETNTDYAAINTPRPVDAPSDYPVIFTYDQTDFLRLTKG